MIVYHVGIIDYWEGWQTPEQVFRPDTQEPGHTWDRWVELWGRAQRLARGLGWEGDVREGAGPFVTVVPNRPGEFWECAVLIGWKQDNNGDSFIASERFALPWLDKCEHRSG